MKSIFFTCIILLYCLKTLASTSPPHLNFSDITSGPDIGIGDGHGSGAIVTVWGNNLGSSQNESKIFFVDSESIIREASHVYYWKDANGDLPGGPSDLYQEHEMQEIAFSIPKSNLGQGYIFVTVKNQTSNKIPFFVRSGHIYHIKSSGNDISGNGSWESPWLTLSSVLSGDGKISAGDIVYSSGVGSPSDVNIGSKVKMVGTESNPYSVLVYPNTSSLLTGTISAIRNWNSNNYYWNFSKFTIETQYQAFSLFQGSRIIGNLITGPTIKSGYSGWIGGGCAGTLPNNCGGHRIYGNEVYNYGIPDGTVDAFHHLFYISNRSGKIAEGYEIAWNYLHDNPVYQGIHIYDQEACGGWSGSIDIHHNFIKNQGGNSININFGCESNPTNINIYNNFTLTDINYNLPNKSAPGAALRIEVPPDTVVNVFHNTFDGWGSPNSISGGNVNLNGNNFNNTRGIEFISGKPTTYAKNNFWDNTNSSTAPEWSYASKDPNLGEDRTPDPESPLKNEGDDKILERTRVDFIGTPYIPGTIEIGSHESRNHIIIKSIKY